MGFGDIPDLGRKRQQAQQAPELTWAVKQFADGTKILVPLVCVAEVGRDILEVLAEAVAQRVLDKLGYGDPAKVAKT